MPMIAPSAVCTRATVWPQGSVFVGCRRSCPASTSSRSAAATAAASRTSNSTDAWGTGRSDGQSAVPKHARAAWGSGQTPKCLAPSSASEWKYSPESSGARGSPRASTKSARLAGGSAAMTLTLAMKRMSMPTSCAHAVEVPEAPAGILGPDLEPPVVAAQLVAGRVLDGARPEQGEPGLRADGVRGRVADRRERVQRAVPARRPHHGDQGGDRPRRDAAPLPAGQHGPPALADRLVPPGARPHADPAHPLAGDGLDDGVGPGPGRDVPRLALGDLLGRLRAAEVLHHRRVPDERLQQGEVFLAPGLEPHVHGGSVACSAHARASEWVEDQGRGGAAARVV